MSTPLLCTVFVDNRPFADTAADYASGSPTALSGLAVTWGRSTTLDQPEASTCSLTAVQRGGTTPAAVAAGLTIGRPITVAAAGTVYPNPTVPTFLDPGFETGNGPNIAINATTNVQPAVPLIPTTNLATNPSFEATSGVVTVRTNLCNNPTPASQTGYSVVNSSTVAYDAAVQGVRVTCVAGGTAASGVGFLATMGYVGATTYTMSADITAVVADAYQMSVQGAMVAARVDGPVVQFAAGETKRMSLNFTTTAATTAGSQVYVLRQTAAKASQFIVRNVLIEALSVALPFFSGSTPSTDSDLTAAWTGTANASTSVLRGTKPVNRDSTGVANAARVSSTQWAASKTRSVRVIPLTGSNDSYTEFVATGSALPVAGVQGKTYTLLGTCRLAAPQTGTLNDKARRLAVTSVTSGGNVDANSDPAAGAAGTSDLRVTFTVPTDATYVTMRGYNGASLANGDVWWDNVMLVEGAYAGPWFSGDTPDTPDVTYAWTGPPNASTSTATRTGASAALRVVPLDASQPAQVVLAPAPFSTAPNAWDDIPTTAPGQRWSATVKVKLPEGARVDVAPVWFADPTGRTYTTGHGFTTTGTGAWQQVDVPDIYPVQPAGWIGVSIVVDQLGTWGEVTTSWANTPGTWLDAETWYVDDVTVLAPAAGTVRNAVLFTGRITDVETTWNGALPGGGGTEVKVTAADFTADLGNTPIGDEPWPVQTLSSRVERILQLAGPLPVLGPVTALVDSSVAATKVTYRDIDSQPASGLVAELAASVDAIAWSAVHQTRGAYYHLEDPANRPALLILAMNATTGLVQIVPAPLPTPATPVSGHHVPRDGVQLVQSVADISTIVDVTWLEQGTDDDGKPTTTERHESLVDAAGKVTYGTRRISLSTQLQAQTDARVVAGRLAARTGAGGWRIKGLTLDTGLIARWDTAMTGHVLDLLDGTTRLGRALIVADLPAWVPLAPALPAYLEGGQLVYDAGRWLIDMTVSSAGDAGASGAWGDADPTWAWDDVDPRIGWADLYGVGA